MNRNLYPPRLVTLALGILLGGWLAGCALVPKAHSTPDQEQARVAQLARVGDIVSRVGVVVEQGQALEIQLHADGLIKDADHVKVQAAFQKTAFSVQAALQTLQASATSANQIAAIKALADGLGGIANAVGALNEKQSTQLAVLLNAAKAILDAAAPLLT